MRRHLVVFFALCLIAWFEFSYFPGHNYFGPASQVYVAALEHLKNPGFLSRDLAATHPNFGLTVYDEVTLLLTHVSHSNIQRVLWTEHFLARAAGLFGLVLLSRALGLRIWHAVALAATINLGTYLPGAGIWLFDPEPVPRAFSFGPFLLALGLFARGHILMAGFFAGCALLLDQAFAAPLWIILVLAFVFDRKLRPHLRPLVPVLLVFVLLLANLAQLQQGTPDSRVTFASVSAPLVQIIQYRSPELWITLWQSKWIYVYLGLFTLFVWALTRLWTVLNRQTRWLLLLLAVTSVLSIPASAVLVDELHSAAVLSAAPLHQLAILALLTWILCATAAVRACYGRRWREAACWVVPVLLLFLPTVGKPYRRSPGPNVNELAAWARMNTWGSSVFLFPEIGKSSVGGLFRAEAMRALWVDWAGGAAISHYPKLAPEWFLRWRSSMEQPLTGAYLQAMLAQPIDYFVVSRARSVEARTSAETRVLTPAFQDNRFAVYEASTLRVVPGKLLVDGR